MCEKKIILLCPFCPLPSKDMYELFETGAGTGGEGREREKERRRKQEKQGRDRGTGQKENGNDNGLEDQSPACCLPRACLISSSHPSSPPLLPPSPSPFLTCTGSSSTQYPFYAFSSLPTTSSLLPLPTLPTIQQHLYTPNYVKKKKMKVVGVGTFTLYCNNNNNESMKRKRQNEAMRKEEKRRSLIRKGGRQWGKGKTLAGLRGWGKSPHLIIHHLTLFNFFKKHDMWNDIWVIV